MRKKYNFKIGKKYYVLGEVTVGQYYISLFDAEQFINDLFLEFNKNIPKLDDTQIKEIYNIVFDIKEENILNNILNIKKTKNELKVMIDDFHIQVGHFMNFFSNGYQDTINIPLSIFNKLLDDLKIISGDEKYNKNRNKDKTTPEKRKLKKLMTNLI